nr:oxoglutarate dehydrogenase inhibitor-like [Nerophis lumbriciformis]
MIWVLWATLLGTARAVLLTLRGASSADPTPPPRWVLVAESRPLQDHRFELGRDGLILGRDPESCQLIYAEETVSRRHAQFRPSDHGVEVTNLSATNRTYVNGEPVSRTVIHAGDSIRIHDLELRLVDEAVPG